MQYTFSKEADKKVAEDLEIIIKEIRNRVPKVLSIILTGGFARGEGPIKKVGQKFIPYNDYDLQIISLQKVSKEEIDDIATKISKVLGYGGIKEIFYPFKKTNQKMAKSFYIDLKCDTPADLKKFLPRLRNYELKYASKIIYGKEVRNLIPGFKMKEIPLSDSAKLLLDRVSQLIEYYSTKEEYDPEILSYSIQQAYAACCTSLLVLVGKYETGYKKSTEIFKQNYSKYFPKLKKKIPDLDKKIEQFFLWKVNPNKKIIANLKDEWFIVKENILEVAKYFFGEFLSQDIKTEDELVEGILNMRDIFYTPYINIILKSKLGSGFGKFSKILVSGVSIILKYKYNKRLNNIGIKKKISLIGPAPELSIFASVIYLISSISRGNKIDYSKLLKGIKILKMAYPVKSKKWDEISEEFANAYIAFFMQKI
ncbi:hypothetical protein HN832_01985 [archaeon]|jgi:hypothetical protein|nr:hypothetical protein [archaeon]MBT4373123.1 hypothetical protein [archaeon]MBT4531468.1 hypothetical protein [archaeon]MBT7001354.1 hypothetical protein [archaeon]MBT7282160.1 hypothetical protein [archaeon]